MPIAAGSAAEIARRAASEASAVTHGVRAHRPRSSPSIARVPLSASRLLIGGGESRKPHRPQFLIPPPAASLRRHAWEAAVSTSPPRSFPRSPSANPSFNITSTATSPSIHRLSTTRPPFLIPSPRLRSSSPHLRRPTSLMRSPPTRRTPPGSPQLNPTPDFHVGHAGHRPHATRVHHHNFTGLVDDGKSTSVLVPPLISAAGGGSRLMSRSDHPRDDGNTSTLFDHQHQAFTSLLDMKKSHTHRIHTVKVAAPTPQVQRSAAHEKTLGLVERSRAPQATPKLVVYNPHGQASATNNAPVRSSSRRVSPRRLAPPTSTSQRAYRNFYIPAPLGGKSSYLNYYRGASPHMLSHLAGIERARASERVRRMRAW